MFALGFAMHFGFYETLSLRAAVPADLQEPAARIWAEGDSNTLGLTAVAMFILSGLVAPIVLAVLDGGRGSPRMGGRDRFRWVDGHRVHRR